MSSVSMRKVELLLLKSDIDAVLKYLATRRCFQVIYPDELERLAREKRASFRVMDKAESLASNNAIREASPSEITIGKPAIGEVQFDEAHLEDEQIDEMQLDGERLDEAQRKLDFIGQFLGIESPKDIIEDSRLPDEDMLSKLEPLFERCSQLKLDIDEEQAKVDGLAESIHEAKAFSSLSRPFEEFEKFSYVSIQIGKVAKERIQELSQMLGDRAVIIPLDEEGTILAASSRKGRFAFETALSKVGFEKKKPPEGLKGIPSETMSALEGAYQAEKLRLEKLLTEKKELKDKYGDLWRTMVSSIRLKKAIALVESKLEKTRWAYRLSGWVPENMVDKLVKDLLAMLGNRISIRVYDPPEHGVSGSDEKQEAVPVLLKHNPFVSAFQGIVLSYGTPLYGDIDPTPFVAFFFTLLFAIMFGDVGQGMVIAGLGLAMLKAKKGLLASYKKYAHAFIAAGLGSMIMGLLVGSFFTSDTALIPIERAFTGLILGKPADRFLQIMPRDNVGAMFYFFGFTLAVGVIINSTGLVINIINLIRRKEYGEAFFSKTGLAGALLFWWAIGIVVRIILGSKLGAIDIIGIGLPLLAIIFAEPLKTIIEKGQGRPHTEGASSWLIGGIIELLDIVSYFASNTFSFLRVGAFALAHAVLSFVIFTMGSLVRGKSVSGLAFEILVFLFGNAVIIVLEGLIVTIQVIRLQYYEFFSKFFTRTGEPFKPVSFAGKVE
ncbi:MAG TPA: V-type ATPase 116kDa subunit family protein [Rectinema sp.]|nr:V-type ATPase 116kDa subunit family protein [Rectinema sp.]